jgi:hypothetical protein
LNGATPSTGSLSASVDFASPVDAGPRDAVGAVTATPNPARSECTIRFAPSISRQTTIDVHDVAGRRVRSLGRIPGDSVRWDTRDDHGRRVAAGVYIVSAGPGTARRLVVIR